MTVAGAEDKRGPLSTVATWFESREGRLFDPVRTNLAQSAVPPKLRRFSKSPEQLLEVQSLAGSRRPLVRRRFFLSAPLPGLGLLSEKSARSIHHPRRVGANATDETRAGERGIHLELGERWSGAGPCELRSLPARCSLAARLLHFQNFHHGFCFTVYVFFSVSKTILLT